MATADPPTFYRDIKPLFSQWDRIQMIGRFDLWSYADVKSRAAMELAEELLARYGAKAGRGLIPLAEKIEALERRKVYDTTQPGRGNGGHTFGDDLTEDERRAVIEYLKTL